MTGGAAAFSPGQTIVSRTASVSRASVARSSRPIAAAVGSKPVQASSFDDFFPQGKYLWQRLTGKPKKTAVVTGASSGLGKEATRSLIESGEWHVVMACRDVDKAKAVAEEYGFDKSDYTVMKLELGSLKSVRKFARDYISSGRPCECLVCNAAVYLPNQPGPTYTEDGFEESMGVNHLGHYLLCRLFIPHVAKSNYKRIVIVGSITGNTNTLGGGLVWPRADLGKLQGFENGAKEPFCMADGKNFNGAKAYKDAKLCNMLTVNELHRRYHNSTGITFSSLYPGCIATTALFRQKRDWFRVWFPLFQQYVIGGFVSEPEAGDRLAQVVASEACDKSGVYWSWNGQAKTVAVMDRIGKPPVGAGGAGGDLFEGELSTDASDSELAHKVWDYSAKFVGLKP